MRNALWTALVLLAAALCLRGLVTHADAQPARAPALPGARPVIHAADYPTLQAALDALPPEGGVVQLPPGRFEITQPLVLSRGDVRIEGAGAATHIHNANTDAQPALIIKAADAKLDKQGRPSRGERLWRVMLANFRITGTEQSGHGIDAQFINEIYLHGLTVSYHGGDGIHLNHCTENPRVIACNITYNKKAGLNILGGHDIVVSSNQFEENWDAVRCINGFNLCMTGNNVDDHLGDGVVIENTYGSVISGNMLEECNGTAVVLDRDCYGITISANVIAHNAGGVDLRHAHGITVSANTFTINGEIGMRIGGRSGRITVTGNNFSDSYLGEGRYRRATTDFKAAGLIIEGGASDIAVSGNVFAGVKPKALTLEGEGTRRVVFTGNVIVGTESDHERLQQSVVSDNLSGD